MKNLSNEVLSVEMNNNDLRGEMNFLKELNLKLVDQVKRGERERRMLQEQIQSSRDRNPNEGADGKAESESRKNRRRKKKRTRRGREDYD